MQQKPRLPAETSNKMNVMKNSSNLASFKFHKFSQECFKRFASWNLELSSTPVAASSEILRPNMFTLRPTSRRKFRSQTSDNMDRWKSRGGKSQRREEERSEKRKRQKKEDAGARKGRKVPKYRVFPMFWGSGGSKRRLTKAAGAEPSGQMRDEELHAVVARSKFRSQNAKNTTTLEHFCKLRCWKNARRSGAKHIWKSKAV